MSAVTYTREREGQHGVAGDKPGRDRNVFSYATLNEHSDIRSTDNNVRGSHSPLSQEQLPGEHGAAWAFYEISRYDVIGIINLYQSGASPK